MNRDPGSFRDRSNQVYDDGSRILRGISEEGWDNWREISVQPFFRSLVSVGKIVETHLIDPSTLPERWPAAMEHERIPFVSYPYEWSFGMLKDAALLHLELAEKAISHGWTLKDASAYNVQWVGSHPMFIDVPSFERRVAGDPWIGYRQFCMMFLIPLLLHAYKGVDFRLFLRSNLEGIDPETAANVLTGFSRLRRGVFGNVYLHSKMQRRAARRELNEARQLTEDTERQVKVVRRAKQSDAMVLGIIQGLARTVDRLSLPKWETTWGGYASNHSYASASLSAKEAFVRKHLNEKRRALVWDLGANTGVFSAICSSAADYVVAVDGDPKAVELLYQSEKRQSGQNVLPLVMDLSNMSPNQGWAGCERKSFELREKPDLVLCLALIHHMVISANIPLQSYITWLRSLAADVIVEFVGIHDAMSQMLVRNKLNQFEELTPDVFERALAGRFQVLDWELLKGGDRKIYCLRPI